MPVRPLWTCPRCSVLKDHLKCGLWLRRRVDDPCFEKVEQITPRDFIYTFRLRRPADLTPSRRRYLAEAYRIGRQEHLGERSGALAGPATSRARRGTRATRPGS